MHIDDDLSEKVKRFLNIPQKHMGDTLNIEFTSFKRDEVKATMPVDDNTVQPFGMLHGGASVVLAETLASVGAWLNSPEGKTAVGIEINANHLRSVSRGGAVFGTAIPVQQGRQIQVWEVRIRDAQDKLVCVSRCTLMMISNES